MFDDLYQYRSSKFLTDRLRAFYTENEHKITRKNGLSEDKDLAFLLARYFLKKDPTLEAVFGGSSTEALYLWLNPEIDPTCHNGSKKVFKDARREYGFCGNAATCLCNKQSLLAGFSSYNANGEAKASAQAKREATNTERYGGKSPLLSEDVKEKVKATNLERYGHEYVTSSSVVQEKMRESMVEKYGVTHNSMLPSTVGKRKENHLRDYGVHHPAMLHYGPEARRVLLDRETFVEAIAAHSVGSLAVALGVDATTIYDYASRYSVNLPMSSYETEIAAFLDSIGIEYKTNTRTVIAPLELDFYIPELNVGIEFNGLYWHSNLPDNLYHKKKYDACAQAGVRLIMINEDEWLERRSAIQKKIVNLLGKSERGVGARKLAIREIDTTTAASFCEKHHIQGAPHCEWAYGAFDGDYLVGVMAFNRQRGTRDVELIRFCSDGKTYAGMFSKLFKYSIEDKPDIHHVISFADLRYSDGGVYEKNFFLKDNVILPDYRYTKANKSYHKSSFTKAKIAQKFGLDTEGKTERQLTEALGYRRIYDCGKIKYIWNRF